MREGALIQIIGQEIMETGTVFFVLLPFFIFYTGHLERFIKGRPLFQIFLFSIFSLFLFPLDNLVLIIQDSILMGISLMFLLTFNLLFPQMHYLYDNWKLWPEASYLGVFGGNLPAHLDDFIRPKLSFLCIAFMPIVAQLYWKFMVGD